VEGTGREGGGRVGTRSQFRLDNRAIFTCLINRGFLGSFFFRPTSTQARFKYWYVEEGGRQFLKFYCAFLYRLLKPDSKEYL
jgi:hypothetical protein